MYYLERVKIKFYISKHTLHIFLVLKNVYIVHQLPALKNVIQ